MLPGPEGGDAHYEDKNYFVPWCRFSPYVAGVVLGYILHKTKNKEIKIAKVCAHYLQFIINTIFYIKGTYRITVIRKLRIVF